MPILVYLGDDEYLIEAAVQQCRQELVNPAMAGLGHRVVKKPKLADSLEAVGFVSLNLGGQTLIELWDFPYLSQSAGDKNTEKQLDEFQQLLIDNDTNKTILFVSPKADARLKFSKWLINQSGATVKRFEAFKFWETDKGVDFVLQVAKERFTGIQPQAAEKLVQSVGLERRLLVNELDKLSLLVEGRPVNIDDVNQLGLHSDNLFTLVQRWIAQESPDVNMRDLSEILLRRHPVEIFAVIQGYFSGLFRTCWLYQSGASVDVIAQKTGQKPFTIKKTLEQYRSISRSRWLHLKQQLLQLEWKAKSGQLTGELALDLLLTR